MAGDLTSYAGISEQALAEQGTTALVCVIAAGRLHVASVGDSRAVLKRGDAPPIRITTDHVWMPI